jgi:nitrite reductase/ring-hydroxylating ferredoxin subunit
MNESTRHSADPDSAALSPEDDRRSFFSSAAGVTMGAGLLAGYGKFAWMAGQMLYPGDRSSRGWVFVSDVAGMAAGASLVFQSPIGAKIVIARQGTRGDESDFAAYSSVCPHLGCQVHWESVQSRFFCPCHNGTFDAQGRPTGGPPLAANQSLSQYPLRIENGMLFIEVPLEAVSSSPNRPEGV